MSSSVETIKDPHDQGQSQAFVSCAHGHVLLDQFDSGADAVESVFYGQGEDAYGSPVLNLASAVFGDGSVADAQAVETVLAGSTFQDCWAKTTDALNAQQGITVPIRPSSVQQLPSPHMGSRSAAFTIGSSYRVLGSTINFQLAVDVVQKGPITVMLLALAFDKVFPSALETGALSQMVSRIGGPTVTTTPPTTPATTAPTACVSGQLARPTTPVLTDAQASADVHQKVMLASAAPQPVVACSWDGARVPKKYREPYRQYTVQLWLGLQFLSSKAEADAALKHAEAPFGPPEPVPGLGASVYVMPGQDEVTLELAAVTSSDDVFTIGLASSAKMPVQRADLIAVARQVLARLDLASPVAVPSCTPTISSVTPVAPENIQTVTISGQCLGVAPPISFGDTPYLRLVDSRGGWGDENWDACSTLDPGKDGIQCRVVSWTNTKVVLAEVSYINPDACPQPPQVGPAPPLCSKNLFQVGDNVVFQLWNPLSDHGPAVYRSTVVPDSATRAGPSYQAGAKLAATLNRYRAGAWYSDPQCFTDRSCAQLQKYFLEVRANQDDPEFGLGLLSHLSQTALEAWLEYITFAPQDNPWVPELATLTASGYSTGALPNTLAPMLYEAMGTGANGNASQLVDAQLMVALANNPAAATFFLRDLTSAQITTWSQNDQGFLTTARCSYRDPDGHMVASQCFELMALEALGYNLMGYADYPEYPGPLSVGQLGAVMYAGERDEPGEAVAVNLIGPWFIDFGGTPNGTNVESVVAWTTPLVNLNGAVASPTGAYIQNAQDWLQGGWMLAEALASSGLGLLVAPVEDALVGWFGDQLASVVGDAAIATSMADGTKFFEALEKAGSSAEKAKSIVDWSQKIYDDTGAVLRAKGDFSSLVNGGTQGEKDEVKYYLTIITETFHEAVARLVQERLLLSPGGSLVTTDTVNGVNAIAAAPKGYTLKGGTPLTVVWGTVWAQFTATH